MGTIISIANQKGGVGKTTSTYNLSAALAKKGKKVLMIDMDIQCSLTHSCTLRTNLKDYGELSTCNLFDNVTNPLSCCFPVKPLYPNIDWADTSNVMSDEWDNVNLFLLPAQAKMAQVQREINSISGTDKFATYKSKIESIRDEYDYIFLDCLPTLDSLLAASLIVSDKVIIPVKPEVMSCDGIVYLVDTIESVKNAKSSVLRNEKLETAGVIITMYKGQFKEHKKMAEQLQADYNVLGTIPLSSSVISGVEQGLPVVVHKPSSSAAAEYTRIATML